MENNQQYNTLLYKPHIGYHQCHPTHESTTTTTIPHSDYMLVNNGSHISNYPVTSSILSSYPLISDSSCSTWGEACPTDYLGLPTFDPKQQTSPSASPLSSSSTTSLDMVIHSSAEDFCVSDLLDSYAQPQQHMSSPALTTHTTMTTTTTTTNTTNPNYPAYFSQHSSMPPPLPPQGVSPNTEYWISPETPLLESMDGLMTTNPISTMDCHQQPYFFIKQEDHDTNSSLLTTPSPFMFTIGNSMHHYNDNKQSIPLIYNNNNSKKKAKKVHHCPHCHHTSNRANNMKEHILTHDPYRPKIFACDVCQKSFARKHDMKRHTKSHLRLSRKQTKSSHLHHPHYQI